MNFEAIVDAAMKSGLSAEDIAKNITEALNKKKVEYERLAAKKKSMARQEVIDGIYNILDEHINAKNSLDLGDASAIIWLSIALDTKEGKLMDNHKLCDLWNFISDDVSKILDRYKTHDPDTSCKCSIKSKVVEEAEPTGKAELTIDNEKINAFLRELLS